MSSSDRRPYETALVLDQNLLNNCHDNLSIELEQVVNIVHPNRTLRVSNRNKYVDGVYYEARTKLPVIRRTLGEWLSAELEFSALEIEVSNADSAFTDLMPGGVNFSGWIDVPVTVQIGLRDRGSTYFSVFDGFVQAEGGFDRSVKSFTIRARDRYETLSTALPAAVLSRQDAAFANLSEDLEGLTIPIIYGDWTTNLETQADLPGIVINGADPTVNGDTSFATAVRVLTSANDLDFIDGTKIYLKRGDTKFLFDAADITNVTFASFDVTQNGTTIIDAGLYEYAQGDTFFFQARGPDLGGYRDNIVAQARSILSTFGGLAPSQFDANWDTYRDKTTAKPADSILSIKSRIWLQENTTVIEFALSLLEQVRIEMFIDRNLKLKLNSLHFDDWEPDPNFRIQNTDVERDSFVPKKSERNDANRMIGEYKFNPESVQNSRNTSYLRNNAAISQAGREISKRVIFPQLYIEADAVNQLTEILKLASSYAEEITLNLTWRSILLDLGDFVSLNVNISGTQFSNAPCMVREIGYNPEGFKLECRLWSFALTPFEGYTPTNSGITGGVNAAITVET